MFTLDSTTASLEVVLSGAITTNQLPIVSSFADKTTTTFTPGKTTTATNSTSTVTIVAAPAASTQREVHSINVYNADTVAATITIRENDNATLRILVKITLAVGDTLRYTHADGWRVTDANGNIRTTFSGAILAASSGGTGLGSYAIGDILYADTTATLAKLPDVAVGSYLRSGGVNTAPLWSTATLPNSATTGDLLYASATNVYSNLADVAIGNALISGGVTTAPSWGKIELTTHVSGVLPVANGGTGSSSGLPNSLNNRLINSGFSVNQRLMSATAVSDDAYSLDRWNILTQTASIQVSQQSNQENGTPNNIRLNQNQASAQRMGVEQIVEGLASRDLRGKVVMLKARIRCSSSQAIRYAILEWTGTEDSVTSDVVNDWTSGIYTAGNFFLASNVTVTAVGSITPSAATWTDITTLTGTCGSSTNNVIAFFWTEGTAAQNVTLDIGRTYLGLNSTNNWEPVLPGMEIGNCRRYMQPLTDGNALAAITFSGFRVGTNLVDFLIVNTPVMRGAPILQSGGATFNSGASPTGNQYSIFDNVALSYLTAVGAVSLSFSTSTSKGVLFRATAATSFSGAAGSNCAFYLGNTANIFLDAEL